MARALSARLTCECLESREMLSATIDLSDVEFRTIDGADNNLANPLWGAAETQQIRFGYGARFPDVFGDAIITEPQRPNPRTISNALFSQNQSIPNARYLTDWVTQWGQFLTHDLDLTRNGSQWNQLSTGEVGDFRIPILDPTDPLYNPFNPFIPFNRSEIVPGTGVPGQRREVINAVTSYIDGSMVYGSDPIREAALRTFQGGRMKTSGPNLLPLNTAGLENADQFGAGASLFLAGDPRANEQVGLTATHILFVREHNRLADRIVNLYPGMGDEEVFQLARRLVGAQIQKITYEEYLPSIFGWDFAPDPQAAGYDPTVNASVTNAFAHAFFRFAHSQISDSTLLVNNLNQVVGNVTIQDAFFNPNFIKDNPLNVGRLLKGLASQVSQEVDLKYVDGVRNALFGPPGSGGLDLAALDIQRSRDHGLPDYNNLRGNYGLEPVTSFAQITSDPALQSQLQQLFGNVDNIDALVGALAEDHLPGSSAGPLLTAIVSNQFIRLRDGDRFFYTTDALLHSPEVRQILDIDKVTLSRIIRDNTLIFNIQDNVFFDRSVMLFKAPEGGANVSLFADSNLVSIVDNGSGQLIDARATSNVNQVILVGSKTSPDVFNLFIAGANGGITKGVFVYGGNSEGDRLNVFGRLLVADTFNVAGATISNNTTSANDSEVVVERSVESRKVSVNGNAIFGTGLETVRLVTLGGRDTINDPATLAVIAFWWDPNSDD